MNALEQIHNRRSVRAYKQAEVSQEQLKTILEAGIAAPSGKKWAAVEICRCPER